MSALGALGAPDAATLGAAFLALKRGKELFWIAVGFVGLLLIRRRTPSLREARDERPLSAGQAALTGAEPHSAPG
jgi:hypothetical protein